jgi:hypothetical protein
MEFVLFFVHLPPLNHSMHSDSDVHKRTLRITQQLPYHDVTV